MKSYWVAVAKITGTSLNTIKETGAAREREELGDASKKRRVEHVGGDECCGNRRR